MKRILAQMLFPDQHLPVLFISSVGLLAKRPRFQSQRLPNGSCICTSGTIRLLKDQEPVGLAAVLSDKIDI